MRAKPHSHSGWRKYAVICADCGTTENLTRHHIKNNQGVKTGRIRILCRRCHNKVEEIYRKLGIVGVLPLSANDKLQLDYMNGLIPFYSLYGKVKK